MTGPSSVPNPADWTDADIARVRKAKAEHEASRARMRLEDEAAGLTMADRLRSAIRQGCFPIRLTLVNKLDVVIRDAGDVVTPVDDIEEVIAFRGSVVFDDGDDDDKTHVIRVGSIVMISF
jgi:hypothetical protein